MFALCSTYSYLLKRETRVQKDFLWRQRGRRRSEPAAVLTDAAARSSASRLPPKSILQRITTLDVWPLCQDASSLLASLMFA